MDVKLQIGQKIEVHIPDQKVIFGVVMKINLNRWDTYYLRFGDGSEDWHCVKNQSPWVILPYEKEEIELTL